MNKVIKITSIVLVISILIVVFSIYFEEWFIKPKFNGTEKAKHVVLISIDGVYEADFDFLKTLPTFSTLINEGSYSTEVKSIFPTLTYPVHTSIATGVNPEKHGVFHNHQLQPNVAEENQTWFWYRNEIKANTIYDLAEKNGMRTASFMWPVTGKSKIDYNMPEILALPGENQVLKVLLSGSIPYLISSQIRLGNKRVSNNQPYLDEFSTILAADVIKNKKPNLTMIHLVATDDARHSTGVFSERSKDSLVHYDTQIGNLIKATKDSGIYDDTVFVVVSDHGLIDIERHVYLNNLLVKANLYDPANPNDYKAYIQSNGCSASVHIKNNDPTVEKQVREILEEAQKDPQWGIEKVYSKEEMKDLYNGDSYSFAVEGAKGIHFKDAISDKNTVLQSSYGKPYASHGFSPNREGYKNVLFAFGNNIKQNNNLGALSVLDVAPTISDILGMQFYECDGKVIENIYK